MATEEEPAPPEEKIKLLAGPFEILLQLQTADEDTIIAYTSVTIDATDPEAGKALLRAFERSHTAILEETAPYLKDEDRR
ncbi:MAG: hypothetical protein QOE44_2630 [Solirubrobacteraceae bacterium]|jgi:hypothetical protein|nr:hypothetical protein [Solirubrobacteraceae bacterium]